MPFNPGRRINFYCTASYFKLLKPVKDLYQQLCFGVIYFQLIYDLACLAYPTIET